MHEDVMISMIESGGWLYCAMRVKSCGPRGKWAEAAKEENAEEAAGAGSNFRSRILT